MVSIFKALTRVLKGALALALLAMPGFLVWFAYTNLYQGSSAQRFVAVALDHASYQTITLLLVVAAVAALAGVTLERIFSWVKS